MVLVQLQGEFSDREMDMPMLIDRYAVPEHQSIEQCHSVRQPCPQVVPCSMTHFLEPAYGRQQRQYGLHHHPHVPRPALARFLVRRSPSLAWNAMSVSTTIWSWKSAIKSRKALSGA